MTNPFLIEGSEPDDTEFVFVILPGAIEPEDRDTRFGHPLDAELRLAGIGYVSGGGCLLDEPDEDDRSTIVYAGIDVDTIDIAAARAMLRDHLPELGCPVGTRIQYDDLQDEFDGANWHLERPRHDAV